MKSVFVGVSTDGNLLVVVYLSIKKPLIFSTVNHFSKYESYRSHCRCFYEIYANNPSHNPKP